MSDELQKQLAELLRSLMDFASDAKTFASHEVPLLIQEKIAFGRAWNTTLFVVLLGTIVVAWKSSQFCWKKHAEHANKYNDWDGGGTICAIAIPLCGIACVFQLYEVLLVWFAPRLYIVQWLISLTTGGSK